MKYKKNIKNSYKNILDLVIVILIIFIKVYKICFPSVQKVGKGNIKVACIGDSITYGLGVEFRRRFSTYPAILASLLGRKFKVLNYGASSRTLLSNGNHPYSKTRFIEKSLIENPDIIIIMLGSNDSKSINWNSEKYKEEYLRLIRAYQVVNNKSKIYIMTPPRAFIKVKNEKNIQNKVIKNEICPIIEEIKNETGVNIIDIYNFTKKHPEWFADGIHPNRKGNLFIANYIASIIDN
mgnify:FL=1